MWVSDWCFDDEGFSTVGVVLALLITLALIFTSAQVYRVSTASSVIQETADAAVLAAESVVAEFYVAVRVSDACVLSMNLTGSLVMGAGIAALCIPPSAPLGGRLITMAEKIFKARDTFAQRTADGLNTVQRALPFLAAANAAAVVSANAGNDTDAGYFGFALLLPAQGEKIEVGGRGEADDLIADIQENKDDLAKAAEEAQEAAEEANAAKEKGFKADCGDNPGYCMYERASRLASLAAGDNPLYQTVDAWSFSVALRRAKAYYHARCAQEVSSGGSVEQRADSALRKRFYNYAAEKVDAGFVVDEGGAFAAHFPLLPRNTAEMKGTVLYTEGVYPITQDGKKKVMHAFAGCPRAAGAVGHGSIRDLEEGEYETCPDCRFVVSSMGNVAAASTSIENGFEFHYRKVAQAAGEYQRARAKQLPASKKVKDLAGHGFEQLRDYLRKTVSKRIEAKPPGRFGAIALVATTKQMPSNRGFENSFVQSGTALGSRAAISSAVLAADDAREGSTVISSLLDGFKGEGQSLGISGGSLILGAWSALLFAYTDGQAAVEDGLKHLFDGIPLIGPSGLGEWASDEFSQMVKDLGLEPAELDAPKPLLANSIHALKKDGSGASAQFLALKDAASWMAGGSLFANAVSAAQVEALEKLDSLDGKVTVVVVEPFGQGGPSVPLVLTLPPPLRDATEQGITGLAARLRSLAASISGSEQWR